MDRRTYIRATVAGATGTLGALAGCVDSLTERGSSGSASWGPYADETVLDPPSESRGQPIHPIHGDELPSFSVPDPLTGETITDEQFHGERALLLTFFFTNCPDGACPALLQRLVLAQLAARDEDFEDDVSFLAMTFDPEVDTADVLETTADEYGVDMEAGNWHFLRPETETDAYQVVAEDFGNPIVRNDLDEVNEESDGDEVSGDENHDHDHDGDDHSHGDGNHGDGNGNGTDDHDHDDHDHTYTHYNLILLANERGIVERSYPQATQVDPTRIQADMLAVLEG